MKHYSIISRLLRAIIPTLLIALFILAGCSNSTDLDANRIITTDTLTHPAKSYVVSGTASIISASDTVGYYIVMFDSNRKFDTIKRPYYQGIDSARSIIFIPDMTALVSIDTATFPPVIQQLSGSWTAEYSRLGIDIYPLAISGALFTLDSVTAAPGTTFTAVPPNPSILLTWLLSPFPQNNGVIDSLRFTVKKVTPPLAGIAGSGQILLGIECTSKPNFVTTSVQGTIIERSISLRMEATLRISY